jgi:hypothetical protein
MSIASSERTDQRASLAKNLAAILRRTACHEDRGRSDEIKTSQKVCNKEAEAEGDQNRSAGVDMLQQALRPLSPRNYGF